MKKKAKVTKFADFKKKATPPSIEQVLGMMKPLQVPSENEILDQMRNSGHPVFEAFAKEVEKEKRGEKADFRKFSDL